MCFGVYFGLMSVDVRCMNLDQIVVTHVNASF